MMENINKIKATTEEIRKSVNECKTRLKNTRDIMILTRVLLTYR
jgi:hypothetical protein